MEDWRKELTFRAHFYLCANLASVINPDVLEIYHPERGAVGDVKTPSVYHITITLHSYYDTATFKKLFGDGTTPSVHHTNITLYAD